jgi:hypothetical protein
LRYPTPKDLVEALQQRRDGARAQLWHGLRQPVGRLLGELARRHGLPGGDRLTTHALHLAETYLRTRRPEEFAGVGWPAFQSMVLLQLARTAAQPYGGPADRATSAPALPDCDPYHSQSIFLPHHRTGDLGFSGDWFGGRCAGDGSLWVLLADVTGHGYQAYLMASALPAVWQQCWREPPPEPAEMLAAMHVLLEDCLPEGVYAECLLARLGPDGEATVAPAGGARLLLLRHGAARPDLLLLRGAWLGLAAPTAAEQRRWSLADGDELLLGTDGLFDQLLDHAGPEALEGLTVGDGGLFGTAERLLQSALEAAPQRDDITMVLLRRRPRLAGPRTPPNPSRHRSGDVPV